MTAGERVHCLMSVAEFGGVPPPVRATLAAAMREDRFRAGEAILTAHEFADRLFVLCSGEVEVARSQMEGRAMRLGPGALLGELAFFAERMRTATVTAVTDCVCLSLPYMNFREFLLAHPESALRLAERIVQKLLATEAELSELRRG